MPQDADDQTCAMSGAAELRRIEFECIVLEVIDGPDAGLCTKVSAPSLQLGSAADNDVVLTDPTVSRRHAEIRITNQGLLVRDLGSTNGTFCNDVRVIEAFLKPEMTCALAGTKLRVTRELETRQYSLGDEQRLGGLVGGSKPMRELYGLLRAVAPSAATVLIRGESGSGKEVVARTLHALSGRLGPLVVFDASVTDPEMVRNDLFGHVKGAFTGASGAREGAFRRAHGGTLFIDEIGELPPDLQPRLLRALESREVMPVGSDEPLKVDVRVLAATHRDLDAMVRDGTFRSDLFFRLSVITVPVPPLRVMREDIAHLAQHFVEQLGLGCGLSQAALDALTRYHWPGNVRELRNVLERAAVLCGGRAIAPADLGLPMAMDPRADDPETGVAEGDAVPRSDVPAHLRQLERQMIEQALTRNQQNKSAAARDLGISLSTLKRRIAQYGL
ncbi:sigma 54-interacting transcriptional regulator [Thiocapsa sp.]|uniref:sigma 54-interacting transcriptional regulator n=1 Tax=Thiocapsa sp. TaxID=2024551 RepID=UPI003593661F